MAEFEIMVATSRSWSPLRASSHEVTALSSNSLIGPTDQRPPPSAS